VGLRDHGHYGCVRRWRKKGRRRRVKVPARPRRAELGWCGELASTARPQLARRARRRSQPATPLTATA
jgi:hypothetical protein